MNRRDLLKALAVAPVGLALPKPPSLHPEEQAVVDAWPDTHGHDQSQIRQLVEENRVLRAKLDGMEAVLRGRERAHQDDVGFIAKSWSTDYYNLWGKHGQVRAENRRLQRQLDLATKDSFNPDLFLTDGARARGCVVSSTYLLRNLADAICMWDPALKDADPTYVGAAYMVENVMAVQRDPVNRERLKNRLAQVALGPNPHRFNVHNGSGYMHRTIDFRVWPEYDVVTHTYSEGATATLYVWPDDADPYAKHVPVARITHEPRTSPDLRFDLLVPTAEWWGGHLPSFYDLQWEMADRIAPPSTRVVSVDYSKPSSSPITFEAVTEHGGEQSFEVLSTPATVYTPATPGWSYTVDWNKPTGNALPVPRR